MPGYFYAPPPARIGGSQPYAPRLGIVQSGPTPDAPPPSSNQNQAIIARAWVSDPVTVVYVTSIASQTTTTADQPPAYSVVNLRTVVQSWQPQPQPVQYRPFAASQPIVNDPPRSSQVNAQTILRAWVPPYVPAQGYAEIAPLLPVAAVADQPPVPSAINAQTILQSWVTPFIATQGYERIAPLIPLVVADQPPIPSWVNQSVVLNAWTPPWLPPQGFTRIAPALPQVDSPPVTTQINYQTIARQWEPPWHGQSPQQLVNVTLVTIPNVVGETQAQGTTDLNAVGLTASIQAAYSDTVATGLIISQQPLGGGTAQLGDVVVIVISLGSQPLSSSTGAGRRRRRRRYYVEIDGQSFEVSGADEAQLLLARAREVAQAQVEKARAASIRISRGIQRPVIRTEAPELKAVVAQARKEIASLYDDASRDLKIRYFLAKAQEEEEALIRLLM